MELSSSNDKKEITFSQSKAFLIFAKQKPRKNSYISGNETFLYSRKRKPKSFFYFRNFASSKIKRLTLKIFIIFQEMELSSSRKLNKTFQNFITP